MITKSWITPKAEKKDGGIAGKGLFAVQDIKKGEIVDAKAGHIIDGKTLHDNKDIIKGSELQIADDLFLAPMAEEEFEASMMYVNHSCEANLGIAGNILAVAIRDIKAGEELTPDYAMFMTNSTQEFECTCGTTSCRKLIRNTDWQNPELQRRYKGFFSWYLQQKIDGLGAVT
jgi:hypothetical protein